MTIAKTVVMQPCDCEYKSVLERDLIPVVYCCAVLCLFVALASDLLSLFSLQPTSSKVDCGEEPSIFHPTTFPSSELENSCVYITAQATCLSILE